jgi:hypothetical protein
VIQTWTLPFFGFLILRHNQVRTEYFEIYDGIDGINVINGILTYPII